MLRRGREVQRIAGAKPERMLIDELRRRPEMPARHRQHSEALGDQLVEHRERRRALFQADLSGPQLDRHGGGHLGDGPVADQKLRRILLRQPALNARRHRFVGKRRDDQRRIEIEHQ